MSEGWPDEPLEEADEPPAAPGGVREPRRPKPSPREGGAALEPDPAPEDLRLAGVAV